MEDSALSKIGAKLRYHRRLRGMTLQDVARDARCSESMVSKIETATVRPSLTMLSRLAAALETNVSVFFSEGTGDDIVTRAGTRPRLDTDALRRGDGVTLERLVPYAPHYMIQANIHIIAPGGCSDGLISHVGEEVGYLIEGQLALEVDGLHFLLGPGDSFHFDSERPHGYRNPGPHEARVLWLNTPPTF